jgi:hypothetical protein
VARGARRARRRWRGHLADVYGATDHTVALIRPDGYIALLSDAGDVTAVSDYLAATGS